MKYLGAVQEVTFNGKLIVRGQFTPKPGSQVFDNRKNRLGRIRRVFGPVDSPYVSIEPTGDPGLLRLMGRPVYVEGVEKDGKGKRRDRGD
jgi:RNA-binding protein